MRSPEEVKSALVRQWLARAEEDMAAARVLLSQEKPILSASAFHAQQAAEKYLKAFLVQHQIEFPKTHDLDELLDLVVRVDSALAESLRDAIVLTDYGVDIRYPGDSPGITHEEARNALVLAGKVAEAILLAVSSD